MFNDFHESTRNVGMMGVLLGLLVLAGFWGLGMAVLSGGIGGDKGPTLAERIEDRGSAIGRIETTIEEKREILKKNEKLQVVAKELAQKSEMLESEKSEILGLASSIASLKTGLESQQAKFEEYRNQYRANERKLAEGEKIDLSETKGPGFAECVIKEVTPVHLRVMRKAGTVGIHYSELPAKVQDRFQFAEDEAGAFQAKLDVAQGNREKQRAAWQKQEEARKEERALKDLAERIVQTKRAVQAKEAEAAKKMQASNEQIQKAKELEQKAARARAAGRISASPGLAKTARKNAARLAKQSQAALKEAAQLEADIREMERALKAGQK